MGARLRARRPPLHRRLGDYAPLFDPILKKPGKAFYALKYFNALYRLGKAVTCEVEGGQGADGLWCVAAKGMRLSAASTPGTRSGGRIPTAAAFLVNDSPEARPATFDFGGRKPVSCRIVDAARTDAEIPFPAILPPHSFMLVEFA